MPVSDDELRAAAEALGVAPDDWKELARTLLQERKPKKRGRPPGSLEALPDLALWTEYAIRINEYQSAKGDPHALPDGREIFALMEKEKHYLNRPLVPGGKPKRAYSPGTIERKIRRLKKRLPKVCGKK